MEPTFVLGVFWALLAVSWALVGRSWGPLGRNWAHRDASRLDFKGFGEPSSQVLESSGRSFWHGFSSALR